MAYALRLFPLQSDHPRDEVCGLRCLALLALLGGEDVLDCGIFWHGVRLCRAGFLGETTWSRWTSRMKMQERSVQGLSWLRRSCDEKEWLACLPHLLWEDEFLRSRLPDCAQIPSHVTHGP